MTAVTLQKRIISKLKETKDKNLLEDIYKFLNLADEADDLFPITAKMRLEINKGLKDVEEGRVISHSKVKKEIAKWLSK